MITIEALRIYERYDGNIDGFSRRRDPREMEAITDEAWRNIDIVRQRLAMERSVPVSESFRSETSRLLDQQVKDAGTTQRLRELANEAYLAQRQSREP